MNLCYVFLFTGLTTNDLGYISSEYFQIPFFSFSYTDVFLSPYHVIGSNFLIVLPSSCNLFQFRHEHQSAKHLNTFSYRTEIE